MTFDRKFKLKYNRFINLLNMLIKKEKYHIIKKKKKKITVGHETKTT